MTRRRAAGLTAGLAGLLVLAIAGTLVFVLPRLQEDQVAADRNPESEGVVESSDDPIEPVSGGRYVEGEIGFPSTLNPLLTTTSSERSLATLLYRGLVQPDRRGVPKPDLAVEWSISDDGLRYDLTLDPDARWHDGEPVRADDVVFTVALIQDAEFPGDPSLARFWRAITVVRVSDQVVRFELMEPYSGFLNYLTLPVVPKHLLADVLPGDLADPEYDWPLVGTGPFAVAKLDEDLNEITLEPSANDEPPYLAEVVFRYFDSREAAIESFQSGDIDGLGYVPLDLLDNSDSLPEGSRVYGPSLASYTALYFNTRQPVFQDVQTRKAIEAAIDRQQIVDTVLGGQAVPGTSPIPQMLASHAPGNHLDHDPDHARTLLEDAGWLLKDGEEIRQRDGQRLVVPILVNAEDAQRVAVAAHIQEQLRAVGVGVEIQALTSPEVHQALRTRQYTAAIYGWHTETGDPDCFQMWHSSQADEGMNVTGFSHSHADELLMNARRSADPEERTEHYARFQQIFAEQVPAVVLFYPRYHFAVSARIEGAEPVPLLNPSDRVRQIHKWFEVRDREDGGENLGHTEIDSEAPVRFSTGSGL